MTFRGYWFADSNQWFAGEKYDKIIVDKFRHLIVYYESIDVNSETYNMNEYIERILICDQFSRHYDRIHYSRFSDTMSDEAVEMTNYILEYAYEDFASLTPEEQCFILLPLRHTRKLPLIEKSIQQIDMLIEPYCTGEDNIPPIYLRFYKASLESWAVEMKVTHYPSTDSVPFPGRPGLLDKECGFDVDVPIGINRTTKSPHPIPPEWEESVNRIVPNDKNIIISLSGGGDSMTGSYLLNQNHLLNLALEIILRVIHTFC